MNLEEVLDLIVNCVDRLVRATTQSKRNERWWTYMIKEDWNLIKLSWELHGVILRRGKGKELGLDLNGKVSKQLEEILSKAELEE